MNEPLEALLDRELKARGIEMHAHVDEIAEAIRQHFRDRLSDLPPVASKRDVAIALGLSS